MADYVIGDVHGCFDELLHLLEKIKFNHRDDTLIFTGDLINRGTQSLEVLDFVISSKTFHTVLGNHDLYLLGAYYGVIQDYMIPEKLGEILRSVSMKDYAAWIRTRPVLYLDEKQKFLVVHAGIPPQWKIKEAMKYSLEFERILKSDDCAKLLKTVFTNGTYCWGKKLSLEDRLTYTVNACLRMRFCDDKGCLDLKTFTKHTIENGYRAWFSFRNEKLDGYEIYFGHWAAINGECHVPHIYAMDSGCHWGRYLKAICVQTKEEFYVKKHR